MQYILSCNYQYFTQLNQINYIKIDAFCKDWKYFTNFQWKMFSSKTIVWILMLFELVLSCAILIASFAIICAQFQSVSEYHSSYKPRFFFIALLIPKNILFIDNYLFIKKMSIINYI